MRMVIVANVQRAVKKMALAMIPLILVTQAERSKIMTRMDRD